MLEGEIAPEHASFAGDAVHAKRALHQLCQSLGDHQSDARAGHAPRFLPEPVERLEQLRQLFRRQSRAGVADADARALRVVRDALHDDRSLLLVVLDRVGEQVDDNLLEAGPVCLDEGRLVEAGKGHGHAALLRLGLHHGLAFGHDLAQGHRLARDGHLAGFDHRQVEDLVDELQEMPSRPENLADASLLRVGWLRHGRLHQLREAQDRIERAAKLVAHARQKIGLREVGLLRRGLGGLQLGVGFEESLLVALALGDVPRGREYALQRPVPVVEGGGVVRHLRLLAVPGAGRQLEVADLLFAQHQLDRRLGPLRIREVILERSADQLVARAARQRLHLLVDVRDDAPRIGGHQRVDVGFDERPRIELLVAEALIELLLFFLHLLARGVVCADQEIADDGAAIVAQRRNGYDRRKAAAVLADVGQLIDVLDLAGRLEYQGLEARRDCRPELGAQGNGARDELLRIGDLGRGYLVQDFGGGVAQHALRADVEQLDDTLLVGCDAREVGAVEDGVLERPRLDQGLFASDLGDHFRRDSVPVNESWLCHVRSDPGTHTCREPHPTGPTAEGI